MFFRKKTSGGRAYLQIVENRREDGAVRQSGARFAGKAIVVGAVADGEATTSPAPGRHRRRASAGRFT
jgi:hypothetical protein